MFKLFNTLTRSVEAFRPIKKSSVRFYACGPTVYNVPQIGNLRTYINQDVLTRALAFNGFKVKHVMNITDVGHLTSDADTGEDKLEQGAKRARKSVHEIVKFYTSVFLKNLDDLNIGRPTQFTKATDFIREQISLLKKLEKKGVTYRTSDGIYFDTSKFPDYGTLARLDLAGLQEGARVEKNSEKRHPTDFALWKFSPKDQKRQQEWDSPWGVGFPGWHLECSAMAMSVFGPTIDLHAGGVDHLSVHHSNEIAQSETATGKPFVRTWMHSEFLLINSRRMGKSQGNFITLQDVIDAGLDPLAYRLFCLSAHYRSKLNFSWKALSAAQTALNKLRDRLHSWETIGNANTQWVKRFLSHVNNDLDTPSAIALVWELVKSKLPDAVKASTLLTFDRVLGLRLDQEIGKRLKLPSDIQKLVDQRERARLKKDYISSDNIRDRLFAKGYVIEDTPSGPLVKRKS